MRRCFNILLILSGVVLCILVAHRVRLQYEHVDILVPIEKPLARELVNAFANVGITNTTTYTDYRLLENSEAPAIPFRDIAHIRRRLTWTKVIPYKVEAIVIIDSNNARIFVQQAEIAYVKAEKKGNRWQLSPLFAHVQYMLPSEF